MKLPLILLLCLLAGCYLVWRRYFKRVYYIGVDTGRGEDLSAYVICYKDRKGVIHVVDSGEVADKGAKP